MLTFTGFVYERMWSSATWNNDPALGLPTLDVDSYFLALEQWEDD
jgi:hypothetical protein